VWVAQGRAAPRAAATRIVSAARGGATGVAASE
jgi:hypothetical protein